MSRVTRRVALVAALLFAARAGLGQTTGSIEGRLSDAAGGILSGAHVSATSARLQGTRTATTDGTGFFRIPAVPPGDYVVRAALPGFRELGKVVTVRLDGTVQVDFALEPLQTEDVLVSGEGPAIDLTSTTTGTSYTSAVFTRLPVSRNYADLVRSNPGVSIDRGNSDTRTLAVAIYGATSHENQWIVDGVNTTSVFTGTQSKAVTTEFIQEVEVKTGGYGAEYGGALGGVINVVTKSGGNEFHGDAFAYYGSGGLTWDQEVLPEDLFLQEWRIADSWRLDFGADLGGYLWKDRLWFFGAYNRVEQREQLARFESTTLVSAEDRFPSDTAENLYSGKLTWNAASSTNVIGTVFADPMTRAGAAGDPPVNTDPSTWYSARDRGGTDFGVRVTQLFGAHAIAAVGGGYHDEKNGLEAPDGIRYEDWTCEGGTPEAECDFPREPNAITGGYGYIAPLGDRPTSSRQQYWGELTLYRGAHEIEAGGAYLFGKMRGFGNITGGQRVEIFSEHGQRYYVHTFFAVSLDDLTPVEGFTRGAATKDFGFYLQDSWKAAPGLTINAGLRWDGEDIQDYNGDTVLRLRSAWQPRLGVVWDPWRDGATKVFASAGRFAYAMPTAMAAEMFVDALLIQTWNLDPVGVAPDPRVIGHEDGEPHPWYFTGVFRTAVDSDVVTSYQDELTVGVERSFGAGPTVGLKGTYRRLGAAIENRCDLEPGPETDDSPCAIITPGSGGRFARGDASTCNGLDPEWYACGDPGPATPEGKRTYRGLEVFARQTVADRFWLQASYVYSSLRGNYGGGLPSPGNSGDFYYPPLWHNGYGRLHLDRPHRFRLDGYWVTPWRLAVGLQAFAESGAPLSRLGYFSSGWGPTIHLVPRGTEGRLPALWDANLTLAYPIVLGPVTATFQMYFTNMFNNQIPTSVDEAWTLQQPDGYPASIYDPNQEQDNEDYGRVMSRSDPRSFRAALRISF